MRKSRSAKARVPEKPPRRAAVRPRAQPEAIRRAIAASATELLRAITPDQSIPKVLERVGRAADVSRVVVFRNTAAADGTLTAAHCYEWGAADIGRRKSAVSRPLQIPLSDPEQLTAVLTKGKAIRLLARHVRKPLRTMMQSAGIKSALLVPIFVDTRWWGHICFDDCRRERRWTTADIDRLGTLAEMIGAALARARDLQDLADANRVVENSPVVLFRISAQAPYPLLYVSRNVARFGYRAAELMASPGRYLELFHPDDTLAITTDIRRIVSGAVQDITQERRLRRADGRYVWVEARASLLADQHYPAEIEGILIDIDLRWVNGIMAFLAAANFVVSAIHTVLLFAG
jgi:PAS domain S-box-containing protein